MTVLGVFALVIVTVGVSYAFFTYTRTSTNTGTITTGSLDFGFTEETQTINLENAMPIANATAAAVTSSTNNVAVYDFKVAYNTTGDVTTTYDIDILKQDGATLDEKFVKVELTKDGATLGTKTFTEAIVVGAFGKNVAINDGETHVYKLRMWIDSAVAGFDANDNSTGTLTPSEGDNYTSADGQTATAAWAGKTIAIKVKVSATGTAN